MPHFKRVFLLVSILFLTGCASSVKYGDPTAVETVNIQFGSSDLQQIAAKNGRFYVDLPNGDGYYP